MTRRDFLVRLAALVAAPAALVSGAGGQAKIADASRVTWSNIPCGPEHIIGVLVSATPKDGGPGGRSRWYSREEWFALKTGPISPTLYEAQQRRKARLG